ncbi:MAG: S41 family peptidase [Candidatus Marinimicrobia bacterium]|nr:S41 family peptidase [Candidatus Neomarinimicrobiota bacterium]
MDKSYQWETAIDSIWGNGLPTEKKLAIYDTATTTIQHNFACFQNLPVNYDSLINLYRNEIILGISHGRFVAIMNYLSMYLYDGHSRFFNEEVNQNTIADPKIPLVYIGSWGLENRFGAAVTPLPDSSLLVYKVVDDHPLNLCPGDRILGYDGIPWHKLCQIIENAQLPIAEIQTKSLFCGNKENLTDAWLTGVGRNWHLFDTLDVYKYSTGDTVHFETKALYGKSFHLYCTEQLSVEGISMPDISSEDPVSWGIVKDENIGYVYVSSWTWRNAGGEFYNALDSLINVHNIKGLIIDLRYNHGGYVNSSISGLRLLFKEKPPNMGYARRSNPDDYEAMIHQWAFQLFPDSSKYFYNPIAVLVGPKTASATEIIAFWFSYHPYVRIFGRHTHGSFAGAHAISLSDSGWHAYYAHYNIIVDTDPIQYLSHISAPVDENIWFTAEAVANGIDPVVERAIQWIQSETKIAYQDNIPQQFSVYQNYPNPFNATTTFHFYLPHPEQTTIEIYDILGRLVETVAPKNLPSGTNKVNWKSDQLPSGIYFYKVITPSLSLGRKMIIIK